MGKWQRTKGHQFERDISNDLTTLLGRPVKRNLGQARDSGDDISLPPFRIECKRRASIAVYQWFEQVSKALTDGQKGVIVMKADQKQILVIIDYPTFCEFLKDKLLVNHDKE